MAFIRVSDIRLFLIMPLLLIDTDFRLLIIADADADAAVECYDADFSLLRYAAMLRR